MKLPILIFLLALPFFAAAQDIQWEKNTPLTWHDFKGTPDESTYSGARTYSRVSYTAHRESLDTPYHFTFEVHCLFNSDRSWVKSDYKNKPVLAHEQLHFDISELYARKLFDALSKATYTANYKEEMHQILEAIDKERKDIQHKYDAQVAHRNTGMQDIWDKHIHDELERLPRNY